MRKITAVDMVGILYDVFPYDPLFMSMKTIQLKCEECGTVFDRLYKEYKRNKKLNRKIFCCRKCQIKNTNKNRTSEFYRLHNYDLSAHAHNRQDDYSPFKAFLNKGRASNKNHKMSLNIEYLKSLWEKQKGVCPYTGIEMILPKNTSPQNKIRSLKKASLDRIDSSKEYVEGNVEFVCMAINSAKNSFTKEEMKEFLSSIDLSVTRS